MIEGLFHLPGYDMHCDIKMQVGDVLFPHGIDMLVAVVMRHRTHSILELLSLGP